MKNFLKKIKSALKAIDTLHRKKAINDLEWEVQELKHIFGLLTMAQFIGLPSVPLYIAFELIPDMEEEFAIITNKINTAHSPLSDHFSKLDVS